MLKQIGKGKRWRIAQPDMAVVHRLVSEVGVSTWVAKILTNRGITDPDAAKSFLNPDIGKLHSPWLLPDMDGAVKRILLARERQETVAVHGDYDVDGVTSSALMAGVLEQLGFRPLVYIPHRLVEGYGLSVEALDELKRSSVSLVVTVDCGITANQEVEHAKTLGIDVVITDHHEPSDVLPDASAIVNAKRSDSHYPDRNLAGVGVAWKLAVALLERAGLSGDTDGILGGEYLDLVTLGTIADVVPLLGENRVIVAMGLPLLKSGQRMGIQELAHVAGLDLRGPMGSTQIAFTLAPRLNAAGRLAHAGQALQLLVSTDSEEAKDLAQELDSINKERQSIEKRILAEALQQIADEVDLTMDRVLVLSGDNWHPGVIGIVANKLVDRYYRPVVMLSAQGSEAKGSARSVSGFHLHAALHECSDLLEAYGGHAQAAGLSIRIEHIVELRQRLNGIAALLEDSIFTPELVADGEVSINEMTLSMVQDLAGLAPFGEGNPEPVLVCSQVSVASCSTVGANKQHLKLRVRDHSGSANCVGFGFGSEQPNITVDQKLDLAFVPDVNTWQGKTTVQLVLRDLAVPGEGLTDDSITELRKRLPDRQALVTLYRSLREAFDARGYICATSFKRLTPERLVGRSAMPCLIDEGLAIFEELGILCVVDNEEPRWALRSNNEKVCLEDSPRFARILAQYQAASEVG